MSPHITTKQSLINSHDASLDWKISVFLANPSVPLYGLMMKNQGYIEFESLEKQGWSYIRKIKTAKNYLCQTFFTSSTHISRRKNLAELWDLPNTLGIFYSKVVASVLVEGWRR
jgi:hypothetical protein